MTNQVEIICQCYACHLACVIDRVCTSSLSGYVTMCGLLNNSWYCERKYLKKFMYEAAVKNEYEK